MGNPLPPRVDGSDAPPGTARQQVEGPAIGLMVTAILGFVAQALQFILNIFGLTEGLRGAGPDAAFSFLTGTIGLVFGVIGVAIGVLILVGAVKMKKLESHSWSMAASILALAPCISPCCIVGLPIGIWSLVVLSKPEVSDAFKERTPPDA
jgi:hypothetical protein